MLLYNNPARTGVNMSANFVVRASKIENIVGIKDSSGDMTLTAEYIRRTDEAFSVLAGRDTLIYGTLCYGGKGAHCSNGECGAKGHRRDLRGLYGRGYEAVAGRPSSGWRHCGWPLNWGPSRW